LILVSVGRLTGHAHRPAQHQEADGHDPTPSDADGYARPRDEEDRRYVAEADKRLK
jgi:hypothetical protein